MALSLISMTDEVKFMSNFQSFLKQSTADHSKKPTPPSTPALEKTNQDQQKTAEERSQPNKIQEHTAVPDKK